MKALTLISVFALSLSAAGVSAHGRDHYEWARVVDVDPVYRWVNVRVPQQQCWTETVATEVPSSNRVASTLAGGVIGGVIGHAAGNDHRSRHVGAAVGTVVGMAIGNDVARKKGHHSHVEYREVEHCKVVDRHHRERELVGYDVTYRLHGHLYRTHTQHHPGHRIQVSSGYGKKHRSHHGH